jgi:hypothetical protein
MTTAADELGLERLWVVHASKQRYPLRKDIEALPVRDVATAIERW